MNNTIINQTFAFIFDSGRLGSYSYGDVVFKAILKGKELYANNTTMSVFNGDISSFTTRQIDIEPYITNDKYCTIDFSNIKSFLDWPYCWIVHNLEYEIAKRIDARLKIELPEGYVGLSKIDFESTDKRKNFWKNMPHMFDIFQNNILCFQDPILEDCFTYAYLADELGFNTNYDCESFESPSFSTYMASVLKSIDHSKIDPIKTKIDLIDRDLLQMNFMLCRESQIAGALLWKSITEIDKIDFFSIQPEEPQPYLIEYSFLTLYQAAQGIERLQKIIVELICKKKHLKKEEKENVFKILFGHNHTALNDWIEGKESLTISSNCRNLLGILQSFYNDIRYYRYSDNDNNDTGLEYKLLFKLKPGTDPNNYNSEIKNRFGKMVGQLATTYFSLIKKLCSDLNIYVDELEYDSCAMHSFYCECEGNNLYEELLREKRAKKELIYWIIKNGNSKNPYKDMDIKPLDLDINMVDEYLSSVINNADYIPDLSDYVSELYDEICSNKSEKLKDRMDAIDALIANPNLAFFSEDE